MILLPIPINKNGGFQKRVKILIYGGNIPFFYD
jgi:hypothetical protein